MEIVAALLLAFGVAAYLRFRRWPAFRAIVLASFFIAGHASLHSARLFFLQNPSSDCGGTSQSSLQCFSVFVPRQRVTYW
mgnify:CR=1 FL=1